MILLKHMIFFFVLCPFSCQSFAAQYKVVTTTPYAADLIGQLSCHSPLLEIHALLSPGIDPHTYQLTPKDRALLESADTVVAIGKNLDGWALKTKTHSHTVFIVAEEEFSKKFLDKKNDIKSDPHIWHSPRLTKQFVKILSKSLQTSLDSTFLKQTVNREWIQNWQKCTQNYLAKIEKTRLDLVKDIQKVPEQKRSFATNHDSLHYFAQEFGFHIYSVLGVSDDAAPTADQMKVILDQVKQQRIQALFLETTGNPTIMETLSREAHVTIGGELYGDSFGPVGSGAETTLGVWKTNVAHILKVMTR